MAVDNLAVLFWGHLDVEKKVEKTAHSFGLYCGQFYPPFSSHVKDPSTLYWISSF